MAFDADPISEEEWAKLRKEATQTLPPELVGKSIPDILMPQQKQLLMATATHQLVVSDKSRRVGFTWAVGADAVLVAGAEKPAGGQDVLYIGYNLDMAREFIDTCAMWAKAFMPACTEVGEFLFKDGTEKSADEGIQAYRIRFASGFEIVALSSRPRSLRGRQGYVILDEYAFHDDPEALLKAAMALLIWGGKVLVISTHNGVDNPFNILLNEIRSGKRPGKVVHCTFDMALEQGLYQRICLKTGKTWSAEAEAKFRADTRKFYGAGAAEELDCIPSQGSGVYLSRALIEACSTSPGPVLRLHVGLDFEMKPEAERRSYVEAFLEQQVAPELAKLDKNLRHFFGQDFALTGDASIAVPMCIERDLTRRVPFVVEMRRVPHEQQWQVVRYIIENLPRFGGGKFDATGNGSYLAQVAAQKFGGDAIEQVKFSQAWYMEHMPPMKAAFEDREMAIPVHVDLVDDLRQIMLVRGVPMVLRDRRTVGSDGLPRHGDFAPALVLADAASRGEVAEYRYARVGNVTLFSQPDKGGDEDFEDRNGRGYRRAAEASRDDDSRRFSGKGIC